MGLHRDSEDGQSFSDFNYDEEDEEMLNHKKRVRQMIEDRLERKRLREELADELDSDFDWNESDL